MLKPNPQYDVWRWSLWVGQAFDNLNHLHMEHKDDDDDDVSFAKWMSSFWGHSWIEENERGLRDHHGPQNATHRKTSLPCPFPVLPRITSSDSHPRRHSHEDQGFQCHTHMLDYRKCSADESFKEALESKGRSHSKIQAFSESFEQKLCFRTKRSISLGPESRKERRERECLRMEIKSRKKVEERRNPRKEEHGEAHMSPLVERESK
ncbi:leukemia NUP98 fusion partner 1 isoform X1 [Mustela erminea]|uniref:leukemia NUP98 fusion partner 1 isoform X1 n=2 Tax=Mustela erminea TaxID=36723 RepID=UPI001386A66B|nr:leukemia NUP98 fusion partner 1 isoform X1 [Mustela erminea]XP_032206850.1 leukemia NUP98 fusion partner 1 isoform X1 [Mustela erminea]XP_032206859.1 leukemia NUP98 fusion partner 1 isoform X1 [Mustela erminea]